MKQDQKNIGQFVRKNRGTLLLTLILIVLLTSSTAKSWTLRQLMRTGLFNAGIPSKPADTLTNLPGSFDFKNVNGDIINTASLKGKVIFINFWASWCPPCRAEFPSIENLYQEFKDDPGIIFLLLNEDDDISLAAAYLTKEKYTVPLYQRNSAIPGAIYTGTLPTTVIIDKQGYIRYKKEGFASYSADNFIQQLRALINE